LGVVCFVSLVICVGACALWARSYFVGDRYQRVKWSREGEFEGVWVVYSVPGGLVGHVTTLHVSRGAGISRQQGMKPGERTPWAMRDGTWYSSAYAELFSSPEGWSSRPPVEPTRGTEGSGWGFYWGSTGVGTEAERHAWGVPLWVVVMGFGVLPGIWAVGWVKRKRRRRAGECVGCGYDLTGNVSGVCPECGSAIDN